MGTPTLGVLKFKPQVINRPLANEDSSTHVTYHLDYNQSPELNHVVQRHQNTLSITNYMHSFLDSSQHENTEALWNIPNFPDSYFPSWLHTIYISSLSKISFFSSFSFFWIYGLFPNFFLLKIFLQWLSFCVNL